MEKCWWSRTILPSGTRSCRSGAWWRVAPGSFKPSRARWPTCTGKSNSIIAKNRDDLRTDAKFMKSWLVVVQWMVLATAMAAPVGLAQAASSTARTNSPARRTPATPAKTIPDGNRFLFILETSAAMNKLEHGGRQAIFDLIYSGMDGRMRNGDTYGIWTFNELPYVGFYPMQIWDARKNLEQATAAGRFLKTRKYEKNGNLTNLLQQVQTVVRMVKDLNVVIVTDANTLSSGTPFDPEINAQYLAHAPQVRETKRPLITTLTARAGQFTAS